MEELEGSAHGVSLRAAACMLAGDARDPVAGERVRRAVDAQLRRAGVAAQDAGDVRTDVVLALLSRARGGSAAAARARVRPRRGHRAQQGHRPRAPQRPARRSRSGDDLPEPRPAGERPGSLADGLDEVAAAAHRRRVRADLALALEGLDAPQRAAIGAHAGGGAARASGLPRSTYYRALGHAQARLRSDLRGRLAGLGALGDLARRASCSPTPRPPTPPRRPPPSPSRSAPRSRSACRPAETPRASPSRLRSGRWAAACIPRSRGRPRARALRQRVTVTTRTRPVNRGPRPVAAAKPRSTSCSYDPSAYDC